MDYNNYDKIEECFENKILKQRKRNHKFNNNNYKKSTFIYNFI